MFSKWKGNSGAMWEIQGSTIVIQGCSISNTSPLRSVRLGLDGDVQKLARGRV